MACTLCHRNSLKWNDKKIFDFPKGIHLPVPEFALICSVSVILYVSNYNKTKQKDNTVVLGFINRLPDNDISPLELLNIFNLISIKFFSTKKKIVATV